MNIFLTGVNGYLGTHLARFWTEQGHAIFGADRPDLVSPNTAPLRRFVPFSFGELIPIKELRDIDVVVHFAYDRKASVKRNVDGTREVYVAAVEAGVPRQIFVSSYSARADSTSDYGQIKYELERFFLDQGHTIVRPGLVVGDGGLFGRNLEKILTTPIMPLLDGGKDLLPVVAMDDLMAAMSALLCHPPGAYNLFNRELVTMRKFIETINRAAQHRAFCFSVPVNLAIFVLANAAKLRVRLPVDLDNLRALKQNQQCIHVSDLEALVPGCYSFESMIEAVVARYRFR